MKQDELQKRLEREIIDDFEYLSTLTPGTDEYTVAAKNASELYRLRIDSANNRKERKRKTAEFVAKVGIDVIGIVLPLIFYGAWMEEGLKFEETGAFTSSTFKGFLNRFKPTKN